MVLSKYLLQHRIKHLHDKSHRDVVKDCFKHKQYSPNLSLFVNTTNLLRPHFNKTNRAKINGRIAYQKVF